ncbi:uncharacterized protein N0V89_011617 [Didymosphaeria variabile]|uniref:Rhodanese domain-containing protein n=1 Tax=Didymosphaeria variabile TaxID=1932322 RepID=A0A9W8XA34_9PLEO|nr:uncharacterized protein N0V89_011617 [Didymosphaeria variabile]KAJ4345485.1 hypothetical protein N0V89_011617 [Didymosphaeria variabile]
MSEAPKANWYDAFPAPKTTAPLLTREDALPNLSSSDLLLVDVRRNDYEGGTVRGWFADYLAEKGEAEVRSLTLVGGIKGWVKAGEPFTQAMDGYDPVYWKQFEQNK